MCCVFFFKQKTAYEMRISDWSSDVCSSDLEERREAAGRQGCFRGVGARYVRLPRKARSDHREEPPRQVDDEDRQIPPRIFSRPLRRLQRNGRRGIAAPDLDERPAI